MRALLRLYPPAWRARYGAEMAAVLDERGNRLLDAPDLIRGALDAHVHPVASGGAATTLGGAPMSLRQAGWAALLGGALWALAYLGVYLSAYFVRLANQGTGQGVAASVGQEWLMWLLVAPALLVAAQLWVTRSLLAHRRLALIPILVSSLGALLMTAKLLFNVVRPARLALGDSGQPEWWVVGMLVMVIGALALGGLLLVTGVVRRRAIALLMVGSVLNAAFLSLTGAAHVLTALTNSTGIVASGAVFGFGWIVLGVVLLRCAPAASPSTPVAVAT